ncbi:hypothetical protein Y032_0097g2975 [Ancylostoma ceylanicum]|uniref:Uncharacterized protein n=1 Tax=Ancylostoma ceylanicum TaxID=53326 RepID=A0A016TJK6_9BILA|nr:hypothetical protein Y032_0097g2975 [Ancylostoma ceylanicum]
MATAPKGIIAPPQHPVHKNHVKFGEDVKPEDDEEKPRAVSPAPPPSEITAPPPAVPCKIKDEVELLRAGLVNKHGDHLKTSQSVEK